jgi:hypothetical protein
MMGGEAFILLKAGRSGPESAKQAEIRLAIFPKLLHTGHIWGENPLRRWRKHMQWLCGREFPLDMANWPGNLRVCYSDHKFS